MEIGACGIACEVCGLYAKGICEGCGSGTTEFSKEKLKKLKKLGISCPVLECAVKHKINYCSRDCDKFPCDKYKEEPVFPYSNAYLDMYEGRKPSQG